MAKKIAQKSCFDFENEKIEEIFATALTKAVNDSNGKIVMDEFECAAEKDLTSEIIRVKVTVYGMAGTTPKHQIHDAKSKHIAKGFSKISCEGMNFKLEESYDLNNSEYVLVYANC
jgi:hypothetical protein